MLDSTYQNAPSVRRCVSGYAEQGKVIGLGGSRSKDNLVVVRANQGCNRSL